VGLLRAALPWAPDSEPASRGAGWAAYRRPQGVIAAITPWNNPLAIPLGKLAPALLFGNTVAWKPAIPGAGIAQRVFELLEDCGCPLGAVTLLQGDHTTAERLISDPGIDAVTLTGSSGAGYAAQVLCARRRIPLQAELGGNNGVIVWGDADLEKTARMLAIGAFGSAGQRCTAARRLIVDTACFGTFLEPFVTAVRALKWGDPLDEATEIGPVISPASRQRIEELVDRARAAGAEVLAPHGPRPEAVGTGCYVPPTIVVCGDPVAEIVQEETFGPVAVIQRAGDWDEALALCNGVRQGLVASLFSRSESRQQDFLAKAQAGMLKINAAPEGAAPDAPFCAWKESGVGPPEHGLTDRDFYCRYQTVYQS
jgi:acyl-CoA reductase-like NAD-dependent aldehyde dehydrogenase